VLFAGLVAFGAWYVQFRMFRTNGLLWSLAAGSLLVPLIDRLFRGDRYVWSAQPADTDPTAGGARRGPAAAAAHPVGARALTPPRPAASGA
jgi:hypothetical protein